jgi:hypothetical protein
VEDDDRADRRRWPRVPVLGQAHGRIYTEAAAPILDLSEGGALLDVPCALRPRSLHSLRLALEDGQVVSLMASVVRSHAHLIEPIGSGESRVRYRAAVQFVGISDATRELLRQRVGGAPPEGVVAPVPGAASLDLPVATVVAGAPLEGGGITEEPRAEPTEAPEAVAEVSPERVSPSRTPEEEAQVADPVPDHQDHPEPRPPARRPLWRRLLAWLAAEEPPAAGAGAAADERREAERTPVRGRMSLELESEILYLSEGGMMVNLPFQPTLGSELSFTLAVGEHPITVRGRVRNTQRVDDGDGVLYQIGVEFADLQEPARGELSAWLARQADRLGEATP